MQQAQPAHTETTPELALESPAQRALLFAGERGKAILLGQEIPNTVDVIDQVLQTPGPNPLEVDGEVPERGWRPFSRYEATAAQRGVLPAAHVHVKGHEEALREAQGWLTTSVEAAEALSLEGLASSGNMETLAERIRSSEDAMGILVDLRHAAYDHAAAHYTRFGSGPWRERRAYAERDLLALDDEGLISYWANAFTAHKLRSEHWAGELQGADQSTRVIELGREIVTEAMRS